MVGMGAGDVPLCSKRLLASPCLTPMPQGAPFVRLCSQGRAASRVCKPKCESTPVLVLLYCSCGCKQVACATRTPSSPCCTAPAPPQSAPPPPVPLSWVAAAAPPRRPAPGAWCAAPSWRPAQAAGSRCSHVSMPTHCYVRGLKLRAWTQAPCIDSNNAHTTCTAHNQLHHAASNIFLAHGSLPE